MLSIRKHQERVFAQAARERFETFMIGHLREFYATETQRQEDKELRDRIRHGIHRAEQYGLVAERDVCLYIDLIFALGKDFDKDPRLPWVRGILIDTHLTSSERIDQLYERAMKQT